MSIPEQPLDERYPPSRFRVGGLVMLLGPVLAVVAVLAFWAAWDNATPDVEYQLETWKPVSANMIEYTVEISRSGTGPVVCDVMVQADDHAKVAETTLRVPAGDSGTMLVTRRVRTERPGGSVTVDSCRLP